MEDLKENVIHSFDEGVYSFNANVNDNHKRFILHFIKKQKIGNETSLESQSSEDGIEVFSFDNNVFIKFDKIKEATITLYDICGKEIIKQNSKKVINKIVFDVSSGYYIIRIQTKEKDYSKKIFID